jgi:hypothetical protein
MERTREEARHGGERCQSGIGVGGLWVDWKEWRRQGLGKPSSQALLSCCMLSMFCRAWGHHGYPQA